MSKLRPTTFKGDNPFRFIQPVSAKTWNRVLSNEEMINEISTWTIKLPKIPKPLDK